MTGILGVNLRLYIELKYVIPIYWGSSIFSIKNKYKAVLSKRHKWCCRVFMETINVIKDIFEHCKISAVLWCIFLET